MNKKKLILTGSMMVLLLFITGQCVYAATSSPKECRWNFQSNEVDENDLIFIGEKKQLLMYPAYNEEQLKNKSGSNGWISCWPYKIPTDGEDWYEFNLLAEYALQIPEVTISEVDHNILNNCVTKYWTNYLFSQRELDVLEPGSMATHSYQGTQTYQLYTNSGNQGLKVYAALRVGLACSSANKHGHRFRDIHTDGRVTVPIRQYYYEDAISTHNISDWDSAVQGKLYDKFVEICTVKDDGTRNFNYQHRLIEANALSKNEKGVTIHTGTNTYPQTFDRIGVECAIKNNRVVIRRNPSNDPSGPTGPDALGEVNKYETHEWKFTILEDNRAFRIQESKFDGKRNFTFKYSGAKTGPNEYISVIVEKGDKTWYGRIAQVSDSRTATFNLPFDYTSDCRICVMNETYRIGNESDKTDFCSNVVELHPPVLMTFVDNGGDCPIDKQYAESSLRAGVLPSAQRMGYVFTGWYEDSNCTGDPVTEDTALGAGYVIDLYAGWVKCPTVTFDACGGNVSPGSAVVKEDGKLSSLPVPTREGYTFLGWYETNTAMGEKITEGKKYTKDTTIYAGWKKTEDQAKTGEQESGSGSNNGSATASKVNVTIKASKTTVKRGKKTVIKISSNSGAKLTVKAKNARAKNKKYVKISSGKTAKLTFTKKAAKGVYKFTVTSPAKGNYKKTSKTIKIVVK